MEKNPDESGTKQVPASDHATEKKWPWWLLIILVLLLLAVAGYLWWQLRACHTGKKQLEKDKQQLQSQIDKLKKPAVSKAAPEAAALAPACNDTPSASLKENIKAALDTKNTAVFTTYTSNPVRFVIAASEKGDNETPDQAAISLEYTHTATGPWDFSLPAAALAHYDAGFYTDYFDANTYVGKAASGMVAAFDLDCNGKIKQIFVAADEDLL
jgi:cytoskeletal protein RodZ